MDIAKKAWTTDGYLDYQEQMRNIPYGKYTIGEKGCGFIAAFNALKASGYTIGLTKLYLRERGGVQTYSKWSHF